MFEYPELCPELVSSFHKLYSNNFFEFLIIFNSKNKDHLKKICEFKNFVFNKFFGFSSFVYFDVVEKEKNLNYFKEISGDLFNELKDVKENSDFKIQICFNSKCVQINDFNKIMDNII
jgi:hypothetical protein